MTPMPPAVGLVELPTPMTIVSTRLGFTPAKSLSGICHSFQPERPTMFAFGCVTVAV